jgi:hypothetical protein
VPELAAFDAFSFRSEEEGNINRSEGKIYLDDLRNYSILASNNDPPRILC